MAGYLYFVTNGGSADGAPGATDGKLLAWKFGVDGSGNPTFAQVGAEHRRIRVQLQLAGGHLLGDARQAPASCG